MTVKRSGKNNRGFFIGTLAVFLVLIALLFAIYYLWQTGAKDTAKIDTTLPANIPFLQDRENPAPAPFPFVELTLPHLREREFVSSISSMNKVGDNSAYESYFASYNSDGLKINGLLTKPKGQKPEGGWPAVVFLHGYIPPKEYRTLVNYQSYVEAIAREGFVVFKIDFRGHDESQGEPGGAYYSGDYVIDTLNAVSALKNTDFVDAGKIGLWGHSMAGNVSFRAFAASEDVSTVVIWAGAVYTYDDMQEFGIDDNSYQPPPEDSERSRKRRELRELYGNYEKGNWFWDQVPATNYLEGVKGAVQINHAVNDDVVGIGYSRNLMKILDSTNIVHELKEYPSGGHNLTGSTFNQAMQNTVNFYKENL